MLVLKIFAIITLLAVQTGCVLAPSPTPQNVMVSSFAWAADSASLYVAKNDAGVERLWKVNLNRQTTRLLPADEDSVTQVVKSNDGRLLALVGVQPSQERYIAVYDLQAAVKHRIEVPLGGGWPANPVFSPDGRFVAWENVLGAADAHSDVYQDVMVYDLSQRRSITIPSLGTTSRLVGFNRESNKLFLWSTFDDHNHSWTFRYDFWEIDLLTGNATPLSVGGPIQNSQPGHWNADSLRGVFYSWEAFDINLNITRVPRNIYTAEINPYRQTAIVTGGNAHSPHLSPDGQRVVYVQQSDSTSQEGEVWVVGIDGGNARRLTNNRQEKIAPQWSPDGELIAFIQVEGENQHSLIVVGANGRRLRRIVP